jgi:hypothetical protein
LSWINRDIKSLEQFGRVFQLVPPADSGPPPGLGQAVNDQVLENAERRYETQVLMYEGEAEFTELTGAQRKRDGPAGRPASRRPGRSDTGLAG